MAWLFQKRWFGTLIFIGLSVAVWWSLSSRMEQVDLLAWHSTAVLDWPCLLFALILLPVNWGLEALKFRTLLATASDLKLARLFQCVLGGISVSMLLPNRIGECIGRLLFFPANQRAAALSATWTGSVLQSIWIVMFGAWVLFNSVGRMDVLPYMNLGFFWPMLIVLVLLSVFLILFGWSLVRGHIQAMWDHFRNILGNGAVTAAGLWALLRYATYSLQFVFLLRFTGVSASLAELYAFVSLVFLFQTILPLPPALGWIGRLELAVFIGGFLMVPPVEAGVASLLLWTINLALPGLYGGYLLLNQHLYKHLDHVRASFISG